MKLLRRRTLSFLALAPMTGLLPLLARAHAESHGPGAAAGPVAKEQKPWGIAAEPKDAKRTIDIRMTDDMRFTPSHIDLREGDIVRLRVVNRGKVMHEIVIGTPEELTTHAELMKKHPDMQHEEPYMVHVSPGKRDNIVWHFNRPGDFEFACLIPGHFEAGMRGSIRVKPNA